MFFFSYTAHLAPGFRTGLVFVRLMKREVQEQAIWTLGMTRRHSSVFLGAQDGLEKRECCHRKQTLFGKVSGHAHPVFVLHF